MARTRWRVKEVQGLLRRFMSRLLGGCWRKCNLNIPFSRNFQGPLNYCDKPLTVPIFIEVDVFR
jgi:hypothetical protein